MKLAYGVQSSYAYEVATVLTVCGIETHLLFSNILIISHVATVLTVCGIETDMNTDSINSA